MERIFRLGIVFLLCFVAYSGYAQTEQESYIAVITERSDKIVAELGIKDKQQYNQVRDVLVEQYQLLNTHHEAQEKNIKALKVQFEGQKEKLETQRTAYEKKEAAKLLAIHDSFLKKLAKLIDAEQIDAVKNGMTYGVLPLTYGAYQDMIPSLTTAQKEKILAYLIEARERAMDEGGSKEKHGVFGKYKGRINNYLSSEGYDLKEEGQKWEERRANKGA